MTIVDYHYRMKVLDEVVALSKFTNWIDNISSYIKNYFLVIDLIIVLILLRISSDDVFLENDSRLLRPVGHDFREHLTLLRRSHPTIFDGREPLYNALSTLYEHARFIAKVN